MKVKVICIKCQKEFFRQLSPSNLRHGKGKYCSRECCVSNFINLRKQGKIKLNLNGLDLGRKQKGVKRNFETRHKISLSLMGKTGLLSRNWKGGATPINHLLRTCLNYEKWRSDILRRDLYTCQSCFKVGGKLNADHIKPWSIYPELRFDTNNGQTLCTKCHTQKTKEDWNLIKRARREYVV